jgi:hypothetical protein
MQGNGAMDRMRQNTSIFNPTDMAMMKQDGKLSSNMTVRDFFAQNGVDVDGPVSQLLKFAQDQVQKASPMSKMQAMAGPQEQAPSEPPPELGNLISQMRG